MKKSVEFKSQKFLLEFLDSHFFMQKQQVYQVESKREDNSTLKNTLIAIDIENNSYLLTV